MLVFQIPDLEVPHGFGTKGGDLSVLGLDPSRLVLLRQVHGSEVFVLAEGDPFPSAAPVGDAAVTSRKDAILGVRTADCLPLFLWAPKGVVGAVHVGWRGLLKGVVERTVEAMKRFRSRADEVKAGIGPGIRRCCCRIGEEVADAFKERLGSEVLRSKDGEVFLDLPGALRIELQRLGVEVVGEIPLCTCCTVELFYSFRRDGTQKRQLSFITLED